MMIKTARIFFCVAILFLSPLASAQTTVFSKDGLSLSYKLESLGTRDIETQPGSIQPMKLYRVRAWFTNSTANDVDVRGVMDVSFFSVSTAWTEAGHGSANFMAGVYKAGSTVEANDIFLLDPSYADPGEPSWEGPTYTFRQTDSARAAPPPSAPVTPKATPPAQLGNRQLLDRFSTLNKGLTANTLKGSELDEYTGITAELNARMQTGKLSQVELERCISITQGKE
jgi:hypothetical protein